MRKGRLLPSDVPLLWGQLPESGSTLLMKLLQYFEIIYDVSEEDTQTRYYFVPHMLEADKPDCSVLWPPNDEKQAQFQRSFALATLPVGLMSRILLRMISSTKVRIAWQYGTRRLPSQCSSWSPLVCICTPPVSAPVCRTDLMPPLPPLGMILQYGDQFANVVLLPAHKTLRVTVRRPRAVAQTVPLLNTIVEVVDALCTKWFSVRVTKFVTCPHCLGVPLPAVGTPPIEPHEFKLHELELEVARGATHTRCPVKGADVEIRHMIPNFVRTARRSVHCVLTCLFSPCQIANVSKLRLVATELQVGKEIGRVRRRVVTQRSRRTHRGRLAACMRVRGGARRWL